MHALRIQLTNKWAPPELFIQDLTPGAAVLLIVY